jgi:hypothetical protein
MLNTSDIRGQTLTDSLSKGPMVTWVSHIFVAKNASQVRKLPAVWEVKATLITFSKV